jgi:O-methyltransferase
MHQICKSGISKFLLFLSKQPEDMSGAVLVPVITFFIVLIVLLILLNYLYTYFVHSVAPFEWTKAKKEGLISRELLKLKRKYPYKNRFYTWWLQIRRLSREGIPGDFAEVGVYKGESALLIHAMDPEREIHLFDTFDGFPSSDLEGETGEAATYTTENFADVNMDTFISRFVKKEKIHIYKGYFPETAEAIRNCRFALVSLDADLYKPTKAALEFFYPRLSPGGVIFVHDHNYKWPGIIRSVDEFIRTIPENPVFMTDSEGTVVIVKNK